MILKNRRGPLLTLAGLTVLLSVSALTVSCGEPPWPDFRKERVTVLLPPVNPAFALAYPQSVPSYTVSWLDENGSACSLSGVTEPVTIDLDKGSLTPVLVISESGKYGVSGSSGGLNPDALPSAGAIYPVHAAVHENSVYLETTWLTGISASCAELVLLGASGGIATGRVIASHFNWLRFEKKMGRVPNPLHLDRERMVAAILSGKVTVYDISEKPLFSVFIAFPDGYIPEGTVFMYPWPGKTAFTWNKSNGTEIEVPEGLSRYFSSRGSISVQTENGKLAGCFFSRYRLQD